MDGIITDSTDNKEISVKEKISTFLFDKENPEMITNIQTKEIDYFSIMVSLTEGENIIRNKLGIENTIMSDILRKNLVFRTSWKGWRANQGERILTSNIDIENSEKTGIFGKIKGRLLT